MHWTFAAAPEAAGPRKRAASEAAQVWSDGVAELVVPQVSCCGGSKAHSWAPSLLLSAVMPMAGLGLPQTALGVQVLLGEMQVERSITHGLLRYPHTAHSSHVVIQATQAARELCRGRRPELDSCITG